MSISKIPVYQTLIINQLNKEFKKRKLPSQLIVDEVRAIRGKYNE